MGFSRKQPRERNLDEIVENLSENFDGFVVVGYQKGDHKKIVIEKGKDPACRDALTFFGAAIQAWLGMGLETEEESASE